ncbi:MAG: hypothetical protein PVG34_10590, partial [Desulfobacterales bacterium]
MNEQVNTSSLTAACSVKILQKYPDSAISLPGFHLRFAIFSICYWDWVCDGGPSPFAIRAFFSLSDSSSQASRSGVIVQKGVPSLVRRTLII